MILEVRQQSLPFLKDGETSQIEVVIIALSAAWN